MKVKVVESYRELSELGAAMIAETVRKKPDALLGLATGATPEGVYAGLCKLCAAGKIDFTRVRTVNLDEYYPIQPSDPCSYRKYMDDNLFSHVNIEHGNTHLPDGSAPDAWAEANRYERLVASLGYPDLQLLGVGQNGHIGFNEPEESLFPETHLTALTASTLAANAKYFADRPMPRQALTMGMGTILRAKSILLLASGRNKHHAVRALLSGKLTTSAPVSFLLLHGNITLLCDREAYEG